MCVFFHVVCGGLCYYTCMCKLCENLLIFVCEHILRNEKIILHFSNSNNATHTIEFQVNPYDILIMQIHHESVFFVEIC